MTDRAAELERLVEELTDHDAVADAWVAKSFTDRLVVIDLHEERTVPSGLEERLADHDLYGSNEVYGLDDDGSQMGSVGEGTRHQFVDVRTRGEHQSYVVD